MAVQTRSSAFLGSGTGGLAVSFLIALVLTAGLWGCQSMNGGAVSGSSSSRDQIFRNEAMRLQWAIVPGHNELPVSPELVEQFDKNAGLSRNGENEKALQGWDKLLSPAPAGSKLVATAEFLGMCYLRKSWVLQDMKRYSEARAVLENPVLLACLPDFDRSFECQYYFTYANTLGDLKDQEGMDNAFRKTIELCKSDPELGELEQRCYVNMAHFAKQHGWQDYYKKVTEEAAALYQ